MNRIINLFKNRLNMWKMSVRSSSQYKCECPVCTNRIEAFLPFGMNPLKKPRPIALCPVRKSLERHRLMWLYFRERTNLFKDALKMLHIAPETQLSKLLRKLPNLCYVTADLDPRHAMVQMDVTNIQYPDNSFDVIYASHVLEHIPDDRKAMRELCRVLKSDGWAILQVPIWGKETLEDPNIKTPGERQKVFGQNDHVRRYGSDGKYRERLEDAGFHVKIDQYVRTLSEEDILRYGLMKNEDIFYCGKKG